jgi:hypothetical protein
VYLIYLEVIRNKEKIHSMLNKNVSILFYTVISNYMKDFVNFCFNIMKNLKIGLSLQLFTALYKVVI